MPIAETWMRCLLLSHFPSATLAGIAKAAVLEDRFSVMTAGAKTSVVGLKPKLFVIASMCFDVIDHRCGHERIVLIKRIGAERMLRKKRQPVPSPRGVVHPVVRLTALATLFRLMRRTRRKLSAAGTWAATIRCEGHG